ncbi:hypothetical protein [Almyronema epifaneia]|uniref:Uncharacterized protein n=1 Tax=Almyronema epifaneia S1 TaxID=2991925 RepID=A0ABW6IDT5_9CYAN
MPSELNRAIALSPTCGYCQNTPQLIDPAIFSSVCTVSPSFVIPEILNIFASFQPTSNQALPRFERRGV